MAREQLAPILGADLVARPPTRLARDDDYRDQARVSVWTVTILSAASVAARSRSSHGYLWTFVGRR